MLFYNHLYVHLIISIGTRNKSGNDKFKGFTTFQINGLNVVKIVLSYSSSGVAIINQQLNKPNRVISLTIFAKNYLSYYTPLHLYLRLRSHDRKAYWCTMSTRLCSVYNPIAPTSFQSLFDDIFWADCLLNSIRFDWLIELKTFTVHIFN